MRAGTLRHRVTFMRKETQINDYGDVTLAWVDVKTVWAEIAPLSVKDVIASNAANVQISVRITIRFTPDVDATMRIKNGSKTYQITGIYEDAQSGRDYLTVACSEVKDG